MGYVANSLEANEELITMIKFHFIGAIRHPIQYLTSDRGVTSKKIVTSGGLIRRNTDDLRVTKIEGIQVDQSLLGRILGYGTVTFSGTGAGNIVMSFVPNPVEIKKIVGQLRED